MPLSSNLKKYQCIYCHIYIYMVVHTHTTTIESKNNVPTLVAIASMALIFLFLALAFINLSFSDANVALAAFTLASAVTTADLALSSAALAVFKLVTAVAYDFVAASKSTLGVGRVVVVVVEVVVRDFSATYFLVPASNGDLGLEAEAETAAAFLESFVVIFFVVVVVVATTSDDVLLVAVVVLGVTAKAMTGQDKEPRANTVPVTKEASCRSGSNDGSSCMRMASIKGILVLALADEGTKAEAPFLLKALLSATPIVIETTFIVNK